MNGCNERRRNQMNTHASIKRPSFRCAIISWFRFFCCTAFIWFSAQINKHTFNYERLYQYCLFEFHEFISIWQMMKSTWATKIERKAGERATERIAAAAAAAAAKQQNNNNKTSMIIIGIKSNLKTESLSFSFLSAVPHCVPYVRPIRFVCRLLPPRLLSTFLTANMPNNYVFYSRADKTI